MEGLAMVILLSALIIQFPIGIIIAWGVRRVGMDPECEEWECSFLLVDWPFYLPISRSE